MSCIQFPASVLAVKAGESPGQTIVTFCAEAGLGETVFSLALDPACADQLAAALPLVRSGQVRIMTAKQKPVSRRAGDASRSTSPSIGETAR